MSAYEKQWPAKKKKKNTELPIVQSSRIEVSQQDAMTPNTFSLCHFNVITSRSTVTQGCRTYKDPI